MNRGSAEAGLEERAIGIDIYALTESSPKSIGSCEILELPGTGGMGEVAITAMPPSGGGIILGTAAYMSPEQARGKFVDRRADVWAVGCVCIKEYNGSMRRKSSIDLAKQKERIERARRMTPAQRLQECVNLTELANEFARAQKHLLEVVLPRPRS